MASNKLLIDESPLQVLPSLAIAIGLPKAIFIQQLHYLLTISTNQVDGHIWVYNSARQWHDDNFPFWDTRTIQRIIADLEKDKILVSGKYNRLKIDRTKWYRLDYERLRIITEKLKPRKKVKKSSIRQNDVMKGTDCHSEYDTLPQPLPEITSKTTTNTTTNTTSLPPKRQREGKMVVEGVMRKAVEAAWQAVKLETSKPVDLNRICEFMTCFGKSPVEARDHIRWVAFQYKGQSIVDATALLYSVAKAGMSEPAGYKSPEQIAVEKEAEQLAAKQAQDDVKKTTKASDEERKKLLATAKAKWNQMSNTERSILEAEAVKARITLPDAREAWILTKISLDIKNEEVING